MVLEKICQTCGLANPATEKTCQRCFSDLSAIQPIERKTIRLPTSPESHKQPPVHKIPIIDLDGEKTIREIHPLELIQDPGKKITVRHGDTVGREMIGSQVLHEYNTVSRQHATFKFFNGKWLVKDENSTNGTYIGGKKINPDIWYEITGGDSISFSTNCTFTVQI